MCKTFFYIFNCSKFGPLNVEFDVCRLDILLEIRRISNMDIIFFNQKHVFCQKLMCFYKRFVNHNWSSAPVGLESTNHIVKVFEGKKYSEYT